MDAEQSAWHGPLKSYILGFILSIFLSVGAYFVVTEHLLTGLALSLTLISLGLVQAWIQLVLFLHLGKEPHPRWNLLIFFFMISVVLLIVLGSLWIMANLNYNVMPPMNSSQ
jgi:cytochrome o ubiquinol oxidase operon protein cyoD